jgi:hypothetical protein
MITPYQTSFNIKKNWGIHETPRFLPLSEEIAIETAKTGKVTAVFAVISILREKGASCGALISKNEKPSCQKAERADFPEENTRGSRSLSQKSRKGWIL